MVCPGSSGSAGAGAGAEGDSWTASLVRRARSDLLRRGARGASARALYQSEGAENAPASSQIQLALTLGHGRAKHVSARVPPSAWHSSIDGHGVDALFLVWQILLHVLLKSAQLQRAVAQCQRSSAGIQDGRLTMKGLTMR